MPDHAGEERLNARLSAVNALNGFHQALVEGIQPRHMRLVLGQAGLMLGQPRVVVIHGSASGAMSAARRRSWLSSESSATSPPMPQGRLCESAGAWAAVLDRARWALRLFLVVRTCQRFEPYAQRPANPLGRVETQAGARPVPCLDLTNRALWHACL